MSEWQRLELEGRNGEILPFCPCLGSHLYRVYEEWCKRQGEFRPRPANHFINYIGKQVGWSAGKPVTTWVDLNKRDARSRKMVIPSDAAIVAASHSPDQKQYALSEFSGKAEWLTACFFAFEKAAGLAP